MRDTLVKWGAKQARKYNADLRAGFQYIAEHHHSLRLPHRAELAEGTEFSLHLVEHHYVVFQEHDKHTIIIAGIFHKNMDIPTRLKEQLQGLSQHEIDILKRTIDSDWTTKS